MLLRLYVFCLLLGLSDIYLQHSFPITGISFFSFPPRAELWGDVYWWATSLWKIAANDKLHAHQLMYISTQHIGINAVLLMLLGFTRLFPVAGNVMRHTKWLATFYRQQQPQFSDKTLSRLRSWSCPPSIPQDTTHLWHLSLCPSLDRRPFAKKKWMRLPSSSLHMATADARVFFRLSAYTLINFYF